MRTSTRIVPVPPTRMNSCSSSTRSSFTCMSGGSSPTSSRKSVPLSASSNFPTFRADAPVNDPLSWPKSSDSRMSAGIAPQLIGRNRSARRGEFSWMALATSSFPVPDSPMMSTVERVGATISSCR